MKKINLFPYSRGEDLANSISHIVGAIIAYFGLIIVIYLATLNGTFEDVIAVSIYGTTIILMFSMSSIYHFLLQKSARHVFKKLDHIAVFLLIIGTYTVYTVYMNDSKVYLVYALIIVLSICGIILKAFMAGRFKKLTTVLYVAIGWSALLMIPTMLELVPLISLLYLLVGGILYTVGAIIYMLGKFKYHHFVWHIFVLLAVVVQYIGICILFL